MDIGNTVLDLIKTFAVTGAEIDGDSTVDSLGLDSLDEVEFIMAIEDTFDLEIPDSFAESFECVQDVIAYVTLYV